MEYPPKRHPPPQAVRHKSKHGFRSGLPFKRAELRALGNAALGSDQRSCFGTMVRRLGKYSCRRRRMFSGSISAGNFPLNTPIHPCCFLRKGGGSIHIRKTIHNARLHGNTRMTNQRYSHSINQKRKLCTNVILCGLTFLLPCRLLSLFLL